MAAPRAWRSVFCWEMMIKNDTLPRVKFLHQRLKPKLDKFKQDISRVHASSRVIDRLLFDPLQKSKVYVFATQKSTMDAFLKQRHFESETLSKHRDAKSLQRAMCSDCKDGLLVMPIYLVTEEDIKNGEIDIGEFETNLSENYRNSIKANALIMLMFSVNSKERMQFYIRKVIEIDSSLHGEGECKGSKIFHLTDHLFVEMVSRKIENWMFEQLRTTLDSFLALVEGVKLRMQPAVSGLVIFDKFEYGDLEQQTSHEDMRGSTENKEDQQDIRFFIAHVVEIIGDKTIHSIFRWEINKREHECNVYGPFMKCKSDITTHVFGYLKSFISGLLWGLVSQNLDLKKTSPKSWWEKNAGKLIDNVSHGEISNEILRETEQLVSTKDILKTWKPELEKLIEGNPLKDDIPYEAHISLSRVPGVKAFGILNEKFTVSVDEETLKNNCQVLMDVKEAVGNYFEVDDSTLRPWKKPVFHYKAGASIKGGNAGRLTIFTELYGIDKKLEDLYFLTSKHVAPEGGISVYFETCNESL
ncbi:uncharacterized protein LOC134239196 [Saccostrea cucullata]|uniref:uncharacterized protein LOC134239196 n=1 Tax=Saccostrea cuccullata TaxID=36930 RepID=UPI002ED40721